jgi:phage FluMu gp28-like protein
VAEFAQRPEEERRRAAADFCAEQIKPALAELSGEALSFVGEDFGRSGDLTVIWPLQLASGLRRHTPFVVELRNIPFTQQEEVFFHIVDRLPRFAAGALDARGNGQFLAERAMQRYGAKIQQVMLTAEWYRENMPRYKAAFEDGLIDLPRDTGILEDHRSLVIERGVARAPERRGHDADGGQRHGDSAIAAALAYWASTLTPAAYEYRGVRRGATVGDGAAAASRDERWRRRPRLAGAW